MSRHDSRRQRFLLQGPIEEVAKDSAVRERREQDDDPTRELLDELEQILSNGQAALPSPDAYDDLDDDDRPPFTPRDVVAEGYDPYQGSYDDEYYDEEYYDEDEEDDGIEAVDYWIPAAPYGEREPPRLPPPPREPLVSHGTRRRFAYAGGIAAIFVTVAAATYLVFQMTNRASEPQPVGAITEPVVAEAVANPAPVDVAPVAPAPTPEPAPLEPAPVIVDLEPVTPRVVAEPAPAIAADRAPANGAAARAEAEAAPLFAPAAEPIVAEPAPVAAEPAAALAQPPVVEPVRSEAPVSEVGQTTAWVNMRTGPSNANPVISVVPTGADVGIVACERWCEVEFNGERGWIHGDYIQTQSAAEAVAALIEETAVTPAPFTAAAAGAVGIYDSPFEDGEIVVTVRNNNDIFVVGCDANWCEVRFGADNRRGWVDRRQLRIPDDVTDAAIPPLPAITRDQAAALKAAAAGEP